MMEKGRMRLVTPLLLKLGLYYPLRRAVYALRNGGRSADQVFTDIYRHNRWQGSESRSGEGSSLGQTATLVAELPGLLQRHRIRSILDVPCGDFHWMSRVDLNGVDYTGADIVADVIAANTVRYAGPGKAFKVIDLCAGPLPRTDLLFCRDCMVHLPFRMLASAIEQVRASGATYLMATTFPATLVNRDIALGDFRPLNLQLPPFNFPAPLELVNEHCTESGGRHADKAMGIWRVADLPLKFAH